MFVQEYTCESRFVVINGCGVRKAELMAYYFERRDRTGGYVKTPRLKCSGWVEMNCASIRVQQLQVYTLWYERFREWLFFCGLHILYENFTFLITSVMNCLNYFLSIVFT